MKLHIEHAGNGQTIIASETGPVAYMAPDLAEGVEETLAAAFAAAPVFLADLVSTPWTEEPPYEQAWYWHWNGDSDAAPFIYSVMMSGTNGKCFVANSSIAKAPWCAEVGGWWKKIVPPSLPNAD